MGQITVNGINMTIPDGCNVSIINGRVVIDGADLTGDGPLINKVSITGTVHNVHTDHASVEIKGDVHGEVKAGGNVKCGSVNRNVDARGNVACGGVQGNVQAGGNIAAGYIGGTVRAGGNVAGGR